MKFARFTLNSTVHTGIVHGKTVKEIEGIMWGDWAYTGREFPEVEVTYLAPLVPNQVIGIGRNYVEKAEELPSELPEIPVFFFKPVSSIIGPNETVMIPQGIDQVKFESELAVVIGKEAKNIEESEAAEYIFGYTIGNDVTAPQFFHSAGHWTIGKAFDTFTPLGPVIETELDPFCVTVKGYLNNQEKQNSRTELMVIPVYKMIAYLSSVMTLKPGDVILTGSPVGAELVQAGSQIKCKISEIGTLVNTFANAKVL